MPINMTVKIVGREDPLENAETLVNMFVERQILDCTDLVSRPRSKWLAPVVDECTCRLLEIAFP